MGLLINIIVNILDMVIVYNLFFGLMNREVKDKSKDVVVVLLWGMANGVFVNYVDVPFVKLFLYISIHFYIWNLCREKVHEVLIIDIIIILLMILAQLFILILFQIGAQFKIPFLEMGDDFVALFGNILTTICIIMVCRLPIYRLYEVIKVKSLLKLCIYIMIVLIFINFHRDFELAEMMPYIPLFLYFLYAIIHTIKSISYYTMKFPAINHELRNVMWGIYLSANYNTDIVKIREEINNYIGKLGIEIDTGKLVESDEHIEIVRNFIQAKENMSNKKIETEIVTFEKNHLIPVS